MRSTPKLETVNLIVSVISSSDFQLLVNYQNENRNHFTQWEPKRAPDFFSLKETKKRLETHLKNFQLGNSITLAGFNTDKSEIICLCTFSNIVRGAFQACNLGYSIAEKQQGKGLMFEMLQVSIQYVFEEYNLHRIMANYMPANTRSEKLLNRLGFQKEGLAKSYLKINGYWEDHILTAKINRS